MHLLALMRAADAHLSSAEHQYGGTPRSVEELYAGDAAVGEDVAHGRHKRLAVVLHVRLDRVERQ